jgi:hypothetical protein
MANHAVRLPETFLQYTCLGSKTAWAYISALEVTRIFTSKERPESHIVECLKVPTTLGVPDARGWVQGQRQKIANIMADPASMAAGDEKILAMLAHSAVQKHLDILQGIVSRLAQNSSNCKNWCVTLVAGVLVLSLSKDGTRHLVPIIAGIPILIFWWLDAYYHSLERAFRRQSLEFVRSIHAGTFDPKAVLVISDTRPSRQRFSDILTVGFSTAATIGFYGALLAAVLVVRRLIC